MQAAPSPPPKGDSALWFRLNGDWYGSVTKGRNVVSIFKVNYIVVDATVRRKGGKVNITNWQRVPKTGDYKIRFDNSLLWVGVNSEEKERLLKCLS